MLGTVFSIFFTLLLFFSTHAHAEENSYTIKKIQADKNTVIIESHTEHMMENGNAFILSDEMENKCTVIISKAKNKLGLASLNDCNIKDQLQVGQKVEKDPSQEGSQPTPQKKSSKKTGSSKNQRSFTDLILFPNNGGFLINTKIDAVTQNRVLKLSGSNLYKIDTTQTNSVTDVYYGFLNQLYAGLTFAYQLTYQEDVTDIFANKTTEKREGLFDPTLRLGYRLTESNEMAFDLSLSYILGMSDFKEGANNKTGTPTSGKSVISPSFNFQFKMPNLLFGASFTYDSNSEQKSKAVDGSFTRKVTGGDTMSLLLSGKYLISSNWNAYTAFKYEMISELTDTKTDSLVTVNKNKASSPMSLLLGGQYVITPEKFSLFLSYNMLLSGDYTLNSSSNGAAGTDYTVTNSKSIISFGLQAGF